MSEKYTGGEFRKQQGRIYRVVDQDGLVWGIWEGDYASGDAYTFSRAAVQHVPKEVGITLTIESASAFLVADGWEVVE